MYFNSVVFRLMISYIPTILLCVIVTFSAWAYGGAETWAIYVTSALALVSLVVAVAVSRLQGCKVTRLQGGRDVKAGDLVCKADLMWLLSLAGLLTLVVIQVVNASHSCSADDYGLTMLSHLTWLPATVSRRATIIAILLLLSYSATYWITSRVLDLRGFNIIIRIIILGAVCMALLALLQGSDHEPWDLVGMFLNENSFSSYINLIFPVTLGLARVMQQRSKYRGSRSNPGVLLYFSAGILIASVLLSGSRAGAVISILILMSWVFMEFVDIRRKKGGGKRRWLNIVLPVLPVVGLLVLLGVEIWHTELTKPGAAIGPHIATRLAVARDTWKMFLSRPFFGMGGGTFNIAFPYYKNAGILGFYRHAHNDWLQWLAEFGLVGCGLGLTAVILAFRRKAIGDRLRPLPTYIARGIWLGLAGVALHAVIDFPFRIPAVTVVVAVWIGALTHRKSKHVYDRQNNNRG